MTPVASANAIDGSNARWPAKRPPRLLQEQETREQSHDPERAGDPEALTQQPDPDRHRQQRRRPAGDRIHDRQVASSIGGRQQDEVAGLDDAGHDAERDALDWQGRPAGDPPGSDSRRHDAERRRQHPDRRRPQRIAGGLEPDVPGDVEEGADRDQRDDERVHARTLAAYVPPVQTPRADQQPADRQDRRDHDADDVVRPGHRLAQVLVERQVEDRRRAGRGRSPACRARTWRSPRPRRPVPPTTTGRDRRRRTRYRQTRSGEAEDRRACHGCDDVAAL